MEMEVPPVYRHETLSTVFVSFLSSLIGDGLSVWWLQDTKYLTPKTNMYCNIINQPTDYSNYDPKWAGMSLYYIHVHVPIQACVHAYCYSKSMTTDLY